MTDLEINRLCAEAIGHPYKEHSGALFNRRDGGSEGLTYDPLHDDLQAMALVKKLRLFIGGNSDQWMVQPQADTTVVAWDADLNRAICECVAKMRASK